MSDTNTRTEEGSISLDGNAIKTPDIITRVTANENSAPLTVSSASKTEKDIWDKTAAVAPIISGIFIFLAGGVFTFTYNQQQLKVQEIQTIEKFIPHLTGSEASKKAAILMINSLADAKLAGRIAAIFASQGTVSALQTITRNGSDNDRQIAQQALAKTIDNIKARESRLDNIENENRMALQNAESADGDSSINLVGMAAKYKNLGNYQLAEQLLKQALELVEKEDGPESAEAAIVWRKLAEITTARGNRAQSEAYLKHAQAIEAKPASVQLTPQDPGQPDASSALPVPAKEADATPKANEG